MRIALLFRGPIRPSYEDTVKNISFLKKKIAQMDDGIELDTFLITWTGDHAKTAVFENLVDNYILLKDVDVPYIRTNLFTTDQGQGCKEAPENNFRLFWTTRMAIKQINEYYKKYDFIVVSRTDLRIDMFNMSNWFDKDYYVVPTLNNNTTMQLPAQTALPLWDFWNEGENFFDQFGIGTPEMVDKIFDYEDLDKLKNLYNTSFSRSLSGPEVTIRNLIIEKNKNGANIKIRGENSFSFYMLHPRRLFGYWDKNYEAKTSAWMKQLEEHDKKIGY